jgi:soluble lytic murein transglycosylase-like protein
MTNATILSILALAEVSHGIPNGLLQAICTVESNLKPNAIAHYDGVSGRHSRGICQVQHDTAKMFEPNVKKEELFDPTVNARIAAKYLNWQFERYHNWDRAIIAYNRGSSSGPRTNKYHKKVMKVWKSNASH